MTEEISPEKIYTPKEARDFLKISESTMKRMIKSGVIGAYKVSGQYRIWGREILKLVSPEVVTSGEKVYLGIKEGVKKVIEKW
jgi:excisionase family DNA binding protein